tara:strand:- start:334 stop:1311 length:978 start_codon:yes stop_codon:yes gene_type:complete
MKVLITGADGFIGSHLTEALYSKGYQVRALCQYNSFNNWGWLEDISCKNDIEVFSGDIRDPFYCEELVSGVDIVFHLAALIAIPYSYISPQSYIETNIQGTLNICQASIKNKVSRVLHTSTSEVYGTAKFVPINEDHPLQPQSPYSASKIGADAIAMSFFNSFNLPLTIVRPFNTYGPRQSARAVLPTIITQIANGAKEISLGDTTPTRDFTYVEDTCSGFLELSACDDSIGETVNLGSNSEISIADALEIIKNLMKSDVNFILDKERIRPKNSEVYRLWSDNSKLQRLTNFCPKTSIEEGLKKTIDWILIPENLSRYKSEIYNV